MFTSKKPQDKFDIKNATLPFFLNDHHPSYHDLFIQREVIGIKIMALRLLATKVYECLNKSNPVYLNKVFKMKHCPYDFRAASILRYSIYMEYVTKQFWCSHRAWMLLAYKPVQCIIPVCILLFYLCRITAVVLFLLHTEYNWSIFTWHRTVNKPLFELMMAYFTGVYIVFRRWNIISRKVMVAFHFRGVVIISQVHSPALNSLRPSDAYMRQ